MKYYLYLIFKKVKNKFYSCFFKSLISFFFRTNVFITKLIDFGFFISFKKKNKRIFLINIECCKNIIMKILKLFKIKKEFLSYFIILKIDLFFFIKKNNYKIYISKNFLILPCLFFKIKYNKYKKISKIIKNLRTIGIVPNTVFKYIKKIKKIC